MADLNTTIERVGDISRQVGTLLDKRLRTAQGRYGTRMQAAAAGLAAAGPRDPFQVWQDAIRYSIDATQRSLLFWDTLRRRGNQWIEHEPAGKPVLPHYDSEVLADARTFERPCNHALLRIVPPSDVTVDDRLRPFIIIDPRAGHGPGIGGFRKDSAGDPAAAARPGVRGAGVDRCDGAREPTAAKRRQRARSAGTLLVRRDRRLRADRPADRAKVIALPREEGLGARTPGPLAVTTLERHWPPAFAGTTVGGASGFPSLARSLPDPAWPTRSPS